MPKGPPHISLERAGLPAHGLMAQALCNSSSFHAHSCIIFAICCAPNGGACGQVASAFLLTKLGLGVSLHIPRAGFGGVRIDRRQDCMALAAQRLLALASMFIGCGPGQPHMPSHGIHVTGKLSHCPLLYPVAATWPTQCPQIQSTIAQTVRCPCKPFAWTQGLAGPSRQHSHSPWISAMARCAHTARLPHMYGCTTSCQSRPMSATLIWVRGTWPC